MLTIAAYFYHHILTSLRYFTILILLFSYSFAGAQVLEGVVLDQETKSTIPRVTIRNMHNKHAVYADSEGYYTIEAAQGDTLLFSHTSYKAVLVVMPYTLAKTYKTVEMQIETYDLKQATVKGLTKYQQDSLEKQQMYEHTLNKTKPKVKYTGLGLDGGVGYLADKITGNSKKAKKFKKTFATEEQQSYIDSKYTIPLVMSQTGIKDTDSVATFMNKYPMEYQYARQASDIEIKLWIRDNYEEYKAAMIKKEPVNK